MSRDRGGEGSIGAGGVGPAALPAAEIAEQWEGSTLDELAQTWRVPALRLFATLGSTSDVARGWAAEGAPEGALVLAEEQRAGRGRAGRSWTSPPGLGLWISMVARPGQEALGPLPILVGLELARALDPWTEATGRIRLKWPNDLLSGEGKIGGILTEAAWAGSRLDHVVIGVGLNLLHRAEDFPPELRASARSLASASTLPVSRFDVASAVVGALRRTIARAPDGLSGRETELASRDALLGRRVEVTEPESGRRIALGRAAGIGSDGALLLETAAGPVTVRSGTVRPLP